MNYFYYLPFCILFSLVLSKATLNMMVEQQDGIIILNDINFDEFIFKHKHVILSIFDPMCGHCQKFAKLYVEISQQFKEDDSVDVIFAQLDSSFNAKTTNKFHVEEFPTLIWFHKGKATLYENDKDKTDIVNFVNTYSDPTFIPPADVTVELTSQNFSSSVAVNISIVVFYAPWCGHSRKMLRFLEKGAKKMVGKVPVFKIDGTEEKTLSKKYKVGRYPQVNIFRKGFIYEYNGPKKDDIDGIVDYMKVQNTDASTHLTTFKAYNVFASSDKVTVIGYLDNNRRKRDIFLRIANRLRDDYVFGHITDSDIAEEAYIYNCPSVTIITPALFPTDKGNQVLTIPFSKDQEKMEKAITNLKMPLLGKYSEKNSKYYESKIPIVYAFYNPQGKPYKFWHSKLLAIAKDYKGKITFTMVNRDEFKKTVIRYRHDSSNGDLCIGMKNKTGYSVFHKMKNFKDYDEDDIRYFIESVLKGESKPVFKSEAIPSYRYQDPAEVVKLVGDNIWSKLAEPMKDKLLFIYADWCDKCAKIFVHVKRIAEIFEDIPNIVIAKYDYVNNELTDQLIEKQIKSFPTFFFVKATDTSNLIKFTGNNTKELIIEFVEQHATVPIRNLLRDEL